MKDGLCTGRAALFDERRLDESREQSASRNQVVYTMKNVARCQNQENSIRRSRCEQLCTTSNLASKCLTTASRLLSRPFHSEGATKYLNQDNAHNAKRRKKYADVHPNRPSPNAAPEPLNRQLRIMLDHVHSPITQPSCSSKFRLPSKPLY